MKKNMFKLSVALLAAGMMFSACGGNNLFAAAQEDTAEPTTEVASAPAYLSAEPVTVDFWHTFSGTLEGSIVELMGEFEQNSPGVKVNLVQVPYDAMLQNLLASVAAKEPPALAQLELTLMGQMASNGALTPISELLTAEDASALSSAIIPSVLDANSNGGELYSVPMGYNSNVLYYNTKAFADAGLTESDLPKTWDQLIEVSGKLKQDTNGDGATDVFGYGFPSRAPWILEVRFWQSKAELFDEAGTKALFNSNAGLSVVDNYMRLLGSGSAKMVQTDSAVNQLTDMFAAGQILMFEQSSTAMTGILEKATFDVGAAQFPTMGDDVFSMGGYNLGVFDNIPDDRKNAAAELVKWWTTPEAAAEWSRVSNYMPGIQAAWETDTLKEWQAGDSRLAIAASQLPNARPRPTLTDYPEISNYIADAFEASMLKVGAPKENLDDAASKADELLSK